MSSYREEATVQARLKARMKFGLSKLVSVGSAIALIVLACARSAGAAEQTPSQLTLQTVPNTSLRNEVKRALDKGLGWLEASQSRDGFWSSPDYPAITALGLIACRLEPDAKEPGTGRAAAKKGYTFLLSCVQPDGGIYRKELPSYNTSVSLMALVLANRPEYTPIILKARKFIAGLQVNADPKTNTQSPFVGGIGYGSQDKQPDLSNTSFALEAMAVSKNYIKDKNLADSADLNWPAAIRFIQSCQRSEARHRVPMMRGGIARV